MHDVRCTLVECFSTFSEARKEKQKKKKPDRVVADVYACNEEQSTKLISRDAVHNFIRVSRVVQRQILKQLVNRVPCVRFASWSALYVGKI